MSSRAERRALQEAQRSAKLLARLTDAACEIVLVRHGETQWNVEQRLQGQLVPGPGLTERGRQQAAVLASRLLRERFDSIYSSDLRRATETADIVVKALQGSSSYSSCVGVGHRYGCSKGASDEGPSPSIVDGEGSSGGKQQVATAEPAATMPVVSARVDPRLRERHLGVLQGLTRAEAAELQPAAYRALSEPVSPDSTGGMETPGQLEARAERALEDLAARHPGQRLLVITHGGFLSAAYRRAAGRSLCGKNVNAAINTIRIDAAGAAAGAPASAGDAEQTRSQQQAWGSAAVDWPARGHPGRQHPAAWAVVRWGEADHLQDVGALASAFGGGTAG